MKTTLIIASVLLAAIPSHADTIAVGCTDGVYGCYSVPSGQKCSWLYGMGRVVNVEAVKTQSQPTYDLYEGDISGKLQGKYDFRLHVTQQREASGVRNYLRVETDINGVTVTAIGETTAETRYQDTAKNLGVALHCETDIVPAP